MRTIRSLLVLVALALMLAACAGSSSSLTVPAPAASAASRAVAGSGEGQVPDNGAPQPAPVEGGQVAAVDDAKIIRTGSLTLEVSDVVSAMRTARDGIVAMGGYVGASTTSSKGDQPSAEVTYRIPADRWEQALDLLRGLNGITTKVVTEHTEAIEVTGQVVDLEANIANLRASETALQDIASKATKVSDVLEVQAQLTATRGQIQSLAAQLKDLNDRSAYSSLAVQFNVPIVAVQVASQGWEPGAIVDEAAAAMVGVLQALGTAAIWFVIVWLPILLVIGLMTLIGVWIARRLGLRRRAAAEPPPAVVG